MAFLVAENNLSDLTNVSTARGNLGLGTIATQSAASVAVTGGTIDGTVIGGTTRAPGTYTTIESVAGPGPIMTHDPTATAGAGGYQYRLAYSFGEYTNGPAGVTNYTDDVWVLGFNVGNTPGTRLDNTKPSVYFQWDSKVYTQGQFMSQFWLRTIDTAGGQRYPLIFNFPHPGGTGAGSELLMDYITFTPYSGGSSDAVKIDALNKLVQLIDGTQLSVDTNNVPIAVQLGGDGAARTLPYIDSGSTLRTATPMTVVAPRAGAGALYPGQFVTLQPTSVSSGDIILAQIAPAVTGSLYSQNMVAAPSLGFTAQLVNTDATHTTAYARHNIATNGDSGGDPFISFQVLGSTDWAIGIDNSDSDKFKVSRATALGTNDKLTLDDSGNLSAGGVIRPGSFTVAALPAPSAVGVGAIAYGFNGRKSGEGSGAGTGIPVWCDGTNWRTFYDNTIAMA